MESAGYRAWELRREKRVLVIDNDPNVLDSVAYNLETAGYAVLQANCPDEARVKLDQEIIHAAVVDVRLEDHANAKDQSGLDLAQEIPDYIPFILYTAYESLEVAKRAFIKDRAKNSLDKADPNAAEDLIRFVDALFAHHVHVNFDLVIGGTLTPEEIVAKMEAPPGDGPAPTAEDVVTVLSCLFRDAQQIEIQELLAGLPAPTLTRGSTMLLRVHPRYEKGWGASQVVKLGLWDEIKTEADNYGEFKPYLEGSRLPNLEERAFSRRLGGLTYTLIGRSSAEEIATLFTVYGEQDAKTLAHWFRRFFTQTFSALYRDADEDYRDLIHLYARQLHCSPEKLRAAVRESLPTLDLASPVITLGEVPVSLTNPLAWILRDEGFRSERLVSRFCYCHGDLHSHNILVDSDGHFWLLDFARVEESHAMRDFAELEIDIKFNLLKTVDLSLLLTFERALLAQDNLVSDLPALASTQPSLDKAYRVIGELRHVAADLLHFEDGIQMRTYYLALLVHSLNVLRLRHISPAKKRHALLAAALICERLDTWPDWEVGDNSKTVAVEKSPASTPPEPNHTTSVHRDDDSDEARVMTAGELSLLSLAPMVVLLALAVTMLALLERIKPGMGSVVWGLVFFGIALIASLTLGGVVDGDKGIDALLHVFSLVFGRGMEQHMEQHNDEEDEDAITTTD